MKIVTRILVPLALLGGTAYVVYFTVTNEYFWTIVSKGDNIPIAAMIPIVGFFTWLSLKEALRHDRLIEQGKREQILDEMRK